MNGSTLCVGADVHLNEIVLRAVDKAEGHEVIERFRVTNNLPGAQSAAATMAEVATRLGYTRIEVGWEATGMLWIPFHRLIAVLGSQVRCLESHPQSALLPGAFQGSGRPLNHAA